jgi:quercetin dioxygenase-like cupin family protein
MSDDSHDDPTTSSEATAAALSLLASVLPERAPPAERRAALLAELRGRQRFAPFVAEISAAFGVGRDPLRDALGRIPDESAWQPGLWPGSRLLSTPALAQAHTVIARLEPGSHIASHEHPYRELTYVLDGELTEDAAHRMGPGELLIMPPGSQHAISVAKDEESLVVFAIQPT